MTKSLTRVKPLYRQEVRHFDDLYPTSKALERQVIRTVHSKTKSHVLSLQLRECPHYFQQCHKGSKQSFSNLLRIEFMFIYEKIIFLGFFDLKLPKWDTSEAINEESFVRLLTCPSMFLYNQSELTIFAKFFVKTAAPLLLKCNLLLVRKELFMLLLSIKHIPFPLHRFWSF